MTSKPNFVPRYLNQERGFWVNKTYKYMKNWKTTLFGALAAVFTGLSAVFTEYKEIFVGIAAVCTALLAYYAKDNNVTGGRIAQ